MGPHQGNPTHNHVILQAITIQPQTQQKFSTGTHVEEEKTPIYTDRDFLEKRPAQQKAGKQGKGNITLNNELKS